MITNEKRCYVITPYEKKDIGGGVIVDFDEVFETVVRKSVKLIEPPGWKVERSKDELKAGVITEGFIKGIFDSDLAIIDVSGANPNVYYELGLRHAFRKGGSILIGYKGTRLPFDIAGIKVVWYDHTDDQERNKAIQDIADHLREAVKERHIDSPVYKFLPSLRVGIPAVPCRETRTYEYLVRGTDDRRLGIKTGAITEIKDVDVWVNSENTEMEMARVWEKSISSLIRYYGAKRDAGGRVKEDLIQDSLRKKLSPGKAVAPATVIATGPGELRTRGVKALLHVASVEGQPGFGYRPIREVQLCVTRSLEKLHELNSKKRAPDLLSILFPIFGAGQAGQDPEHVLAELIRAAYGFVKNYPKAAVNRIYFLAYTEDELTLCRHAFGKITELEELTTPA